MLFGLFYYICCMINIDKTILRDIGDTNTAIQALADYLIRNNSIYDIALELSERIIREKSATTASKIVVTEDEYRSIISLFRVKGFNEDGTKSLRGRPKK